jgi:hypothetical protein
MATSFTAQLNDFSKRSTQNLRYVVAEATQDVMELAQTPQVGVTKGGTMQVGKIPVAEGDLIASLISYIGSGQAGVGEMSYTAAIAGFDLGDTLTFAWTSDHALPMEYGYVTKTGKTVPGRQFVGANVPKFAGFIAKHAKEV